MNATMREAVPETASVAVRRLLARQLLDGYRLAGCHRYNAADGTELYRVARLKHPLREKIVRPIHRDGMHYFVEGEACADALAKLGITATTSGGCGSVDGADWRPKPGHATIIWPDNDAPGAKYANDVAAKLRAQGRRIDIVNIAALSLPEHGDVVDWLAQHPNATSADILTLPATEVPTKMEHVASPMPVAITTRMADVAPEPVRWLWQPRIAVGKITIIAGDPGLAKSLLSLCIAANVSMGRAWPDGETCPSGSVVLVSGEDDPADTIRPRLDMARADVNRIHYLRAIADPVDGERSFSLADVAALRGLLQRLRDCRLVVIDPLSAYLGSTDSHKNSEVRGLLAPLAGLAAETGVAIIAITHLNKGQSQAIYRMTGSLAFVAAARAAYVVARDKKDERRRLLLPIKNNLGDDTTGLAYRVASNEGIPFVVWEHEPVSVLADDALAPETEPYDSSPARSDAAEFLSEVLACGEVAADVIKAESKSAGLAWATVRRAKDALGVRSHKSAMSGGWVWRLPDSPKVLTLAEDAHVIDGERLRDPLSTFADDAPANPPRSHVTCGTCRHFAHDAVNPRDGMGACTAGCDPARPWPSVKRQCAQFKPEHIV